MKRQIKKREAGIAMLTTLLGLMVLSAIGAGLIFMTNTETQLNFNFRSEQVAYFAAKAGMEEARDRMMATNPNSISGLLPVSAPPNNGAVLYLINEGTSTGSVQPWTQGNAYMDDELCHDGYSLSGLQTGVPSDVRCTSVPSGNTWYQTTTSTAPWNGTAAAIPYKWARISLKLNGSIQNFPVNPGASLTSLVCWNGSTEVVLPASATNCQSMTPATTPVYLVTSLGVSANGSRKMVQSDVAVTPTQPSSGFGLFATGTGCGAINISSLSGTPLVDSWTSANGGTYTGTKSDTGGNVGTDGNISLSGGAQVGGNVSASNTTLGPCPDGITASGGSGLVPGQNPPNAFQTVPAGLSFPPPPAPNPAPPTTFLTFTSTSASKNLVPGTYGNITLSGVTVTISPGVYNINGLNLSGGSVLKISPAGQVTLNVAGSGNLTPVNFSGGSLSNTTGVPNNFQINYGGTGTVNISGGSGSYLVVDAPKAGVKFSGGSDIFGVVVAQSINDSGGTFFHVDRNAAVGAVPPSGNFVVISFRDLAY